MPNSLKIQTISITSMLWFIMRRSRVASM